MVLGVGGERGFMLWGVGVGERRGWGLERGVRLLKMGYNLSSR